MESAVNVPRMELSIVHRDLDWAAMGEMARAAEMGETAHQAAKGPTYISE
jgi:hypothetical protein